jgi:hypothetical protein
MSAIPENIAVPKWRRTQVRPRPDAWINVYIPSALRTAIERMSVEEDRSMAAQCRVLIALGIEQVSRRR